MTTPCITGSARGRCACWRRAAEATGKRLMRTIVAPFGPAFRPRRSGAADPLVDAIEAAQPDVVAVSGDLTQRARNGQFIEARAFLDRLPMPQIVFPATTTCRCTM